MRDFSNPRFQSFSTQSPVRQSRLDQLRSQYEDTREERLAWEERQRLKAPFLRLSDLFSKIPKTLPRRNSEQRFASRGSK